MKANYLCRYHLEKMKTNESNAICQWTEMMRRGIRAYTECRTDAADVYLNSALQIALVRTQCPCNGIFESTHIVKPAGFLLDLKILENGYHDAVEMLSDISSIVTQAKSKFEENLIAFLAKQYERI